MLRMLKRTTTRFFSPIVHHCPLPVTISYEDMRGLDEWPQDGLFELMFATKRGIPIPFFPISHSAIALYYQEAGTFSVHGRQSPFDFSRWLKDGVKIRTQMDNEKRYLNPHFSFTGYPTKVLFNRAEIEHILRLADQLINEKQYCNMVYSNCYSYSVTCMILFVQALIDRPQWDPQAILRILQVIEQHPLSDHFSFGVLNNTIVMEKLSGVLTVLQARLKNMLTPTDEEKQLIDQVRSLMEQIKQAPQEQPVDSPKMT